MHRYCHQNQNKLRPQIAAIGLAAFASVGLPMETIVVLAVCLDPLLPGTQGAVWSSAGYVFLAANSVKEAINHFKEGDFDLVLLGPSSPVDARERLTFLIRATGSHVPVVCIADSPGRYDSFADATFEPDSSELLTGIGELLKNKAKLRMASLQYDPATRKAAARNLERAEEQGERGRPRQAAPNARSTLLLWCRSPQRSHRN